MISLIVFILILSILVSIHEFGHFIAAKKMGIYVEEFGLGIPPRIFGKRIGETIYSINLLPFGGFVRLRGEDALENPTEQFPDPRSFGSKTPLQRSIVLLAGVFMNVIFGVVLFYVFLVANGFRSFHIPLIFDYDFAFGNVQGIDTVVFGLSEESPLKNEMELGEAITSIGNIPVTSVEDVKSVVAQTQSNGEKEVTLIIKILSPEEKTREIRVIPYKDDENVYLLGVYLGRSVQISYTTPKQKIFSGLLHSYNILSYSISGFGQLIGLSVEQGSAELLSESVTGPIGIYSVVDNILAYANRVVILSLIDFTALISLSLALVNVLPLPALDGGRITFVFIESIRGKRINPKLEALVHKVGILVLMSLLLLVSTRDIYRLFS